MLDATDRNERIVLGFLIAASHSEDPEYRAEVSKVASAISKHLTSSHFKNVFYGEMFDRIIPDLILGFEPNIKWICKMLKLRDQLPDDADELLEAAIEAADAKPKEVYDAVFRIRQAGEIRRAVDTAIWIHDWNLRDCD